MSDLRPCEYYLGMAVRRDRRNKTIYLSQKPYLEKVLSEFNMIDSKPVSTPVAMCKFEIAPTDYEASKEDRHWFARAIGSLMYACLGQDQVLHVPCLSAVDISKSHTGTYDYPSRETNQAVSTRYSQLWTRIFWPLGFPYRVGDDETRRWTSSYVFNLKASTNSRTLFMWSWVYGSNPTCRRGHLATTSTKQPPSVHKDRYTRNHNPLWWQSRCNCSYEEPTVPRSHETYRHSRPLDKTMSRWQKRWTLIHFDKGPGRG